MEAGGGCSALQGGRRVTLKSKLGQLSTELPLARLARAAELGAGEPTSRRGSCCTGGGAVGSQLREGSPKPWDAEGPGPAWEGASGLLRAHQHPSCAGS